MPAPSKHHSAGFSRKDRVNEQIRRELSELIRAEVKDPRVGMVSITEVEVTPDYAHARVYFCTLADETRIAEVHLGLQKASGFLRRELGRRVRIHTTPQLHFIYDASLERGADLSKLIDEAARLSDISDPVDAKGDSDSADSLNNPPLEK